MDTSAKTINSKLAAALFCLLGAWALNAGVGIESPASEEKAPALVFDFYKDGKELFAKRTEGKAKPSLKETELKGFIVERGLGVSMPATKERGGHSATLKWSLEKTASDWSSFDDLELRFRAPAGSVLDYSDEIGVVGYRFKIYVEDADGKKAKTAEYVKPETLGAWQKLRAPLKARWLKDLDKRRIVNVQLEMPALKDAGVDFELAAFGLSKEPERTGPKLSIDIRPVHLLVSPEEAFCFTSVVEGVPKGKAYSLRFEGKDVYGNVWRRSKDFIASSDELEFKAFDLPNEGQGHLTITGTLSMDGKDLYRVEWMMGCLAPQTPSSLAPSDKLPWGFWPGAGLDAEIAGAKWTRLRIHPEWFSNAEARAAAASPVDNGEWRLVQKSPRGLNGICCWFSAIPKECGNDKGHNWWDAKIDWDAYEKLVEEMARHCKAMGIRHYEAINEPNAYPGPKTPELVKLHETVWKGVMKADPEAVVMGPSPYCLDLAYVEKFLEAGGAKWINAVSTHAYNSEEELRSEIPALRALMAKYGLEGKDVYITELGCNVPPHSLVQQARATVRNNVTLFAQGVKAITWHGLGQWGMEPADASKERRLAFTIMQYDGEPSPAYVAYGVMTRALAEASYLGAVEGLPENCFGEAFKTPRGRVSVLWNVKSKPARAELPAGPKAKLIDMTGKERPLEVKDGKAVIELTENPVYLSVDENQACRIVP